METQARTTDILTNHLLPTEDASLIAVFEGELHYENKLLLKTTVTQPQHLYLCSTLRIKEGQYGLRYDNVIVKVTEFTGEDERKALKTIEFATDPKLWDIRMTDVILGRTENIGVPALDKNTKALIQYKGKLPNNAPLKPIKVEVNFLEEYCKRYNQKDNQKGVDVEKIHDELHPKASPLAKRHWIDAYTRALQSQTGGFSSEDARIIFANGGSAAIQKHLGKDISLEKEFNDTIQSLTKSQPKGDIIIECQIEYAYFSHEKSIHGNHCNYCAREWDLNYLNQIKCREKEFKIKLVNGQPVLTFK